MTVKLVRDGQVPHADGRSAPANSWAGKQLALTAKMHEEVGEIADDPTNPYEYADLLEAMLEMAHSNNVPWGEIEAAVLHKRGLKGGFRKGMIAMWGSALRN